MPLAFDYSKWDKLELSDDEDDHPGAKFIETDTLRRMKRHAHEDKSKEREDKLQALKEAQEADNQKKRELLAKLEAGEASEQAKKDVAEIEKAQALRRKEQDTIEKHAKYNADEMCRDAWSVTIKGGDNKPEPEPEDKDAAYNQYVERNKAKLDEYISKQRSYEDSMEYILMNSSILHEYGMGYLLLIALEHGMAGKMKEMRKVVWHKFHIKSLLDFTEASQQDPRSMIRPFFSRLQTHPEVEKEYKDSFEVLFVKLQERAKQKKIEEEEEAKAQLEAGLEDGEELPLEERMGPGGLDPVEVFNSLPQVLQEAYQERDVEKMKDYLGTQPLDKQKDILGRMIDSGLWVAPEGSGV